MQCPRCGKEIKATWKACPACQAPLAMSKRDIGVVALAPATAAALAGCYENSWAVVVGINAYAKVDRLDYAVPDAESVAEVLTSVGFERHRILTLFDADATRQNIQDVLSVEIARKALANDRLVVFFAGHGKDFKTPAGKTMGWFIPCDGDPDYLASRCISMSEVENWSELIPAKHILFVMDCCYSGLAATRATGLDPMQAGYIAEVTRRPVRQIITAGRADQKVIEESGQGVFTRLFVRAIAGDADIHGRGFVTGFDLGHYLESRVYEESNRRQQPLFRYLRGDGEIVFLRRSASIPTQPGVEPAAEMPPTTPQSAPSLTEMPKVEMPYTREQLASEIQADLKVALRVLKAGKGSKAYIERVYGSRLPLWRRAAEAGVPEGMLLLGMCWHEGLGVEKSPAEAVRWYRKAAEQGLADAQFKLAGCYLKGEGVAQNKAEAVRWFRKAAEQGFADAQFKLAGCYLKGEGAAEDKGMAKLWYRKAEKQGFRISERIRKELGRGSFISRVQDWLDRRGQQ